jgi:hypothetical protein
VKDRSLAPLADSIESQIQQDPGNRGLARWVIKDQLLPAAFSLSSGSHCLIFTGFFIPSAGVIETDGPLGTIVLASALIRLGKQVTILIDRHAEKVIRAGLDAVRCTAELLTSLRPIRPTASPLKDQVAPQMVITTISEEISFPIMSPPLTMYSFHVAAADW